MEVLDTKASNNVEELIRIKKLLETKDDPDLHIQLLNRLNGFDVTYDDLFNTKIGKTLKKMTKSKDKNISTQSNKLIDKWKKLIKKDKEGENDGTVQNTNTSVNKEVSKNEKTEKVAVVELSKAFIEMNKKILEKLVNNSQPAIRNSVRKTIYEALVNKEETDSQGLNKIKELTLEIEETIYETLFKPDDKGSKYLSRAKAIASNLQDKKNTDFRNLVLEGSYTPKDITLMDVKKMASSELQSKRLIAEKDSFNSLRSDWHDVHAPVGIGMHTCEKCQGQRTTSKEIQLRGADEPMTLFIRCVDCGNEWRIG